MRTPRQPNYEKTSGVSLLVNTSQHPLADIQKHRKQSFKKQSTPPDKRENCDGVLPYISRNNLQRRDTAFLRLKLKYSNEVLKNKYPASFRAD